MPERTLPERTLPDRGLPEGPAETDGLAAFSPQGGSASTTRIFPEQGEGGGQGKQKKQTFQTANRRGAARTTGLSLAEAGCAFCSAGDFAKIVQYSVCQKNGSCYHVTEISTCFQLVYKNFCKKCIFRLPSKPLLCTNLYEHIAKKICKYICNNECTVTGIDLGRHERTVFPGALKKHLHRTHGARPGRARIPLEDTSARLKRVAFSKCVMEPLFFVSSKPVF